ncbi:MAG TPA: BamA/TamA family outer membrane protein [Leptolyngbyaceae cyanobacterium M33_DOE_097]|uniref:ShlB/FhaC/HecB family hemolysin secretion/activation protein n=1 Tax=Oscillatoriales cyanobacterium SpSt-418 TaxID=2282169 RepID=A0A7C3KEQ6_9CYAN|nr:BamA/TamA family outer membrane protein [Leptolyngbyaceae cyanobacterium M33_DOE_097]
MSKKQCVAVFISLFSLFLIEKSPFCQTVQAATSNDASQAPTRRSTPNSKRTDLIAQAFQLPAPKPLPEPRPQPQLPPADDLLRSPPSETPPEIAPGDDSVTIVVKAFKVVGSTVFSEQQLATVLQPFTNRPLTLTELLQARTAVTQLYHDAGYVTSGAYIPPQEPQDGIVTVQVIEGRVETINITGNRRLRSRYVQSRLELATKPPLNVNKLVEKLRLLQLNPLIENVSAELAAGVQPGTSILNVTVTEADTFSLDLATDNNRTPSIGSWERLVTLREANLLGLGDGLTIGYINTNGSNEVDASYTLPLNARDGTLSLNYQFVSSKVIEDPFDVLDLKSTSQYYDVTYRQPIIKTPTQELALSLTGSYQQSRSEFLEDLLGEAIPFPALGADEDGRVQVAAIRFGQEWTKQGRREVFAVRSQFNFGFVPSDAVITENAPNDEFFSWQGQFQWVRLLAPDTLFLFRSQLQLTGSALTSFEQFTLGGWQSIRGYRQDLLFTDNGLQASAEVRFPLYRNRRINGLLQGIAFFDMGTGWNTELADPDPNFLASLGVGLLWQMGDRLSARFDWGIPLIDVDTDNNSLQEQGLYFSIRYTAF